MNPFREYVKMWREAYAAFFPDGFWRNLPSVLMFFTLCGATGLVIGVTLGSLIGWSVKGFYK